MGKESYAQFEYAKQISKGQDSYARVGLANSSYCISTLRRADSNRQEEFLRQAMNQYFNILERDEHNCAGALGIANVLNEYGKVREANEIYKVLTYNEPNSQTGLQARIN
jgi:thioredoxin-like negative regulator of GroEL